MDIVIDIQGFRDETNNFIAKEVAVVAIDAPFVSHWIMMPPCAFGKLPAKARRENNWLSRNYHGIEWFDGEVNPKYFTSHLREIARHARCIYVRGNEKANYLRNLLSRDINNLEGISPSFKNLTPEEDAIQYCGHHGVRKFGNFHCALYNAYKLKYWLSEQNNCENDSSTTEATCSSDENWEIIFDDDDVQQIGKEEEEEEEEEERFTITESSSTSTNRNKLETTTISTQTDIENLSKQVETGENILSKEIKTGVVQIIPHVRSYLEQTNELSRNSTSIASSRCRTCGSLCCRQSSEGVDEIDGHRC